MVKHQNGSARVRTPILRYRRVRQLTYPEQAEICIVLRDQRRRMEAWPGV
jgi:hypothetical protein